MVPMRSALSGDSLEKWRTMKMPPIEQNRPSEASPSGMNIRLSRAPIVSTTAGAMVAAMAMVAIMAPQ